MDGQRFDDLTRLIATGTTRRRVVSLLGGGLGGLIFGRHTGRAQCANPDTCLSDGECCTGFVCDQQSLACIEPVPCTPDGDGCAESSECCTGNCFEGTCLPCRGHGQACQSMFDCCTADCYLGVCVPCRELGAPCNFEWHCCEGKCVDDTVCVACAAIGSVCSDPAECCGGDCSNGVCVTCQGRGTACIDSAQCCGSDECFEGACVLCRPLGEPCTENGECCGRNCYNGSCVECREDGAHCAQGFQCCSEQCADGVCSRCHGSGESYCRSAEECCSGTCLYGEINYCDGCHSPGVACGNDAQCCSGVCENGTCTPYACDRFLDGCAFSQSCVDGLCYPESWICGRDGDCGDGEICCGGFCRQAECCVESVGPDGRCDAGKHCIEGICEAATCAGDGGTCVADAECCSPLICANGSCGLAEVPGPTPEPPRGDGPPTGSGSDVTALPNTGSGQIERVHSERLDISLTAGAAALLAAKKLLKRAGNEA